MRLTLHKVCASGVLLLVLTTVGCEKRPIEVEVSLNKEIQDRSVTVDIVGIKEADLQEWSRKPISEYWSAGDKLRQNAIQAYLMKRGDAVQAYEMKFGPGLDTTPVLRRTDAIWDLWVNRGVTALCVIADIPGFIRRDGEDDLRRRILPWREYGGKRIVISVEPGGLVCLTSPKK